MFVALAFIFFWNAAILDPPARHVHSPPYQGGAGEVGLRLRVWPTPRLTKEGLGEVMTEVFNKTNVKDMRRRLRNQMSRTEVLVWSRLKGKQIGGFKFRRQYSVGPYSIDFYCPAIRLAIEIDGESHCDDMTVVKDAKRQAFIESFGIRFLRFSNLEVYENLDGMIEQIAHTAQALSEPPPAPPSQGGE